MQPMFRHVPPNAHAFLVLVVVDAGGREAELGGANRCGITCRTAADHDDVEFLVAHCLNFRPCD
jgi:hypothetical protein